MSDVYVVIWVDRHTDPTAEVFGNAEAAIGWAKAQARALDRHGVLRETLVTEPMCDADYLYHATYSVEDDYLCVVKREVRQTADMQAES